MIITLEESLQDAVQTAVEALNSGKTLLYPTDTIYGLGCDAAVRNAVDRIREIKGREEKKPFIVLAGSLQKVQAYFDVRDIKDLLEKMWPGPFTVLLRPRNPVLSHLQSDEYKIAVRVPDYPFLNRLFCHWEGLLVSTSANRSGEPYNHDWSFLETAFTGQVDLLLQSGNYPPGLPSAVLEWNNSAWNVLRPGPLPVPENAG
jgi:L-threonylcarbamoyladenylate synthase